MVTSDCCGRSAETPLNWSDWAGQLAGTANTKLRAAAALSGSIAIGLGAPMQVTDQFSAWACEELDKSRMDKR
jgi:hypothetical protein